MIRVAHLLPNLAVGGRERIVADLCRSAGEHGVMPSIVTYDPLPPKVMAIDVGDVPIVALDRHSSDFAAQLRSLDIDLLHAQGHIAAAIAPRLATPIVATIHMALGDGWRWLPVIGAGLRRADAVTAVSDDLAHRFAFLAGRQPVVIATGVDLAAFAPRQRARAAVFTIGIAARLHPVKRHEDVIAALRLLEFPARLLIAGEGPERARLEALAAGLDVNFLGAVADMPGFYRSLDAFVLVSDHEGTPAALIEAMACGVPSVVSATGGMPDAIGDAGLVLPRRNPATLATALAALASDPAGAARLGYRAAARARRYSARAQASAYRAVYDRVLGLRTRHFAS